MVPGHAPLQQDLPPAQLFPDSTQSGAMKVVVVVVVVVVSVAAVVVVSVAVVVPSVVVDVACVVVVVVVERCVSHIASIRSNCPGVKLFIQASGV